MKNNEISTSEFKRLMLCGNGKCYIVLSNSQDKEKYRQTVLWGCLHNIAFDTQTEGTRAEYLYELAAIYNDDSYFLIPILQKFKKLSPDCRGWDYSHFCDMLCLFARYGNESAATALRKKYNELYPLILKKRKIKGYNVLRDNYERLSIAIVDLEGLPAFKSIAQDMGNLFLQNKIYNGSDFEWFYISFEKDVGKNNLKRYMLREGRGNPAIATFYKSIQKSMAELQPYKKSTDINPLPTARQIIEAADNGKINFNLRINFKRNAAEDQKILLAKAVLDEKDLNKKAELLRTFTMIGFPIHIEKIISYTQSGNKELCQAALDVLADTKNPVVRDYALHLLQSGEKFSDAVSMFILNYQKQDKQILLSCLNSLKVTYADESDWHHVVCSILHAYYFKVKLPKEALMFIYNKSLCSYCRKDAVVELAKRGWLTDEIKAECAHDSYSDIRKYIKKYNK